MTDGLTNQPMDQAGCKVAYHATKNALSGRSGTRTQYQFEIKQIFADKTFFFLEKSLTIKWELFSNGLSNRAKIVLK